MAARSKGTVSDQVLLPADELPASGLDQDGSRLEADLVESREPDQHGHPLAVTAMPMPAARAKPSDAGSIPAMANIGSDPEGQGPVFP